MKNLKLNLAVIFLLLGLLGLVAACRDQSVSFHASASPTAVPSSPAPLPTPSVADRVARAESQYLARLDPELAATIRSQPWFEAMESEHLALISTITESERAARPRGEKASVAAAFGYATRQPWYSDGLEPKEAAGLRGVFRTYAASLSNPRAPQVGPVLASTIEHQLMTTVDLPASGTIMLLASADNPELGRRALELTVRWLPEVEQVTGAFPYDFLHIIVEDLPEHLLGASNDEFILLGEAHVTDDVVIHEITHSTLYGIFPTWFEEGYAYYIHHLLTDSVEEGVARFKADLALLGVEEKLDVGPYRMDEYQFYIDQARGYLFLKGLVEIDGLDEVLETVRTLRTRTFTDQDLLKALVETDNEARRSVLRDYVCRNVSGTIHNYCQ